MDTRQLPLPTRLWWEGGTQGTSAKSCKKSHFWGCHHTDGHSPCNRSPGCHLSHCLFLLLVHSV